MFISLKDSVTAFSPWQPFLQPRTSPLSSEIVQQQSVFPTIPNIHGPCSCMNCQHSKLFPPCHNLRMQHHLLKQHSPLPLNNMLTQHNNMIPQEQQPPCLLRPCPVALHTGTSKISSAFTSAKFIAACYDLGIKLEAAAPEHQEMNGICEAKWG